MWKRKPNGKGLVTEVRNAGNTKPATNMSSAQKSFTVSRWPYLEAF